MSQKVPSYRRQKTKTGRDLAFVELGGSRRYLGVYGSPESKAKYGQAIAEWQSSGRRSVNTKSMTVAELVAGYWKFAETYYVKGGQPTSEMLWIRSSVKPLVDLYATLPAGEFGPLKLKAVRERMIDCGWARKAINARVHRVRRVFRWATENELVPASVYDSIRAVSALRQGRTRAKESPPVRAINESHILSVLECVPDAIRGMILVQPHTGMRPGEVRVMRGVDIAMTGPIWEYRPVVHKLEHRGIERVVMIGPRCQSVLAEFLKPDLSEYLFTPESMNGRPSRDYYMSGAYRRAVARGCIRAGVPHWSPNQIRHTAGTSIRSKAGLTAVQAFLGHKNARTSEIYAEVDQSASRDLNSSS